jgi:hypothetical protein
MAESSGVVAAKSPTAFLREIMEVINPRALIGPSGCKPIHVYQMNVLIETVTASGMSKGGTHLGFLFFAGLQNCDHLSWEPK